jgi:hypothetical protein
MEMDEVMRILFMLPNLESLYMWDFEKEQSASQYPRLHLPALKLLGLYFRDRTIMKAWIPLLISLDAPNLTVLGTNMGCLSSAVSSFPRDIWGRLTYLRVSWKSFRYIKSDYLSNLHHLSFSIGENDTLPKFQENFPFKQLETLTLSLVLADLPDVTDWKPFIIRVLAFPLDTKKMPSLRALELIWKNGGFEASVKLQASHAAVMNTFLTSLSSLAIQFEKRGVQFLELRGGDVYGTPYGTPVLIQEAISACKEHIL